MRWYALLGVVGSVGLTSIAQAEHSACRHWKTAGDNTCILWKDGICQTLAPNPKKTICNIWHNGSCQNWVVNPQHWTCKSWQGGTCVNFVPNPNRQFCDTWKDGNCMNWVDNPKHEVCYYWSDGHCVDTLAANGQNCMQWSEGWQPWYDPDPQDVGASTSSDAQQTSVSVGQHWRALAAGIHETIFQNRVSVGTSGVKASRDEAEAEATEECLVRGFSECHVVSSFSVGCGYITTGTNGSEAGWGSGPSAQEALNSCEARGLSCDTPVGGCVN